MSALDDFKARLAGPEGPRLRAMLLGLVGVIVAGGVYVLLPSDEPPPPPQGAVLPKRAPAPAATPEQAPAATTPAPKSGAAATAKGAPKDGPKDAPKTQTVAAKPAPSPRPADPKAQKPAPAAPAAAKPTEKPATAPAAGPTATTTTTVATPKQAPAGEGSVATIQRESFAYGGTNRRDPFVSLAKPAESGPLVAELKLVGIAYDETGRNSVAVLRDANQGLYRVKLGQSVGRARVAGIGRRSVTFNVDEFGALRQEVITLRDTTKKGME